MILGIGTDIAQVSRFKKWVQDPSLLERFFHEKEIELSPLEATGDSQKSLEYFASRFACKEAFAKALGTGFSSFSLKEVFVTSNSEGKPFMNVTGNAENLMKERFGSCDVHVSLSHEKEYAVAFVVIEKA